MLKYWSKWPLLVVIFSFLSCSHQKEVVQADMELLKEAQGMFAPLPEISLDGLPAVQKLKVKLGKRLYFETKLSKDNTISCNSCHRLDQFGVDNSPTSQGVGGQFGGRNSPTVYNAFLHFSQFWDGRAKDVEEQALGPILNPIEMAMPSQAAVVAKLKEDESYIQAFKEAFPSEKQSLVYKNIGKAIGAFERTLVTPSRFDRYLKGDVWALDQSEREGLRKFIQIGCVSCHDGVGVGGGSFQVLGAVEPYPTKDLGRFEVTKNKDDKFMFKVPSLRNVYQTAPYFHDGSLKTVEEVIPIMAKHQLGTEISSEDQKSIQSFLKALTGSLPDLETYEKL